MRWYTRSYCLLLWAAFVGCDRLVVEEDSVPATTSEAPTAGTSGRATSLFQNAPTVRPNPIARAPLIGIVEATSVAPAVATLQIDDGERHWEQAGPEEATTSHRLAAMGLRPDRTHTIRLVLEDPSSGQQEVGPPLAFKTPPLPDSFPPLQVTSADPERMEPGVTLFAVNLWRAGVSAFDYGYIVALDQRGDVVWYCQTEDRIADITLTDDGHLLYQHGSYRYAYEIDILGRDIRRWYGEKLTVAPDDAALPIPVDTMHHALFELPNGNLMTLATELHAVETYPTSEFDPEAPTAPAFIVADKVVEFDRESGEIVDQLSLRPFLDPDRIGYLSLGGFWNDKYKSQIQPTVTAGDDGTEAQGTGEEEKRVGDAAHDANEAPESQQAPAVTRDWSHANALQYLPEEQAILVSFRHLDCILKIDWTTKKLRWILGDPAGWGEDWQDDLLEPVGGDFIWFYHQHAPHWTPRGTLLLFDNGNYRARPFEEPTMAPSNQSRVVEYRIDEAAGTVEQLFSYWGSKENRFYSPFYCEADWLPQTGNWLITDGGHIETAEGTPHDKVPGERQWARIFEITPETPPATVFEVRCDSGLKSQFGWSIYRAQRLPNLLEPFRIEPPAAGESPTVFAREPHVKQPPGSSPPLTAAPPL